MKAKVLLIISMMLFCLTSVMAQPINESDVPEDVFTGFKFKYPSATILGWETSRGNFIADFKIEDQEATAEFTANGKWVVSKFNIPEKELPSPIATYCKDNYKNRGFLITESVLVKTASGETFYYLQAKKSGISQPKPSELYFDLAGKLTKKEEPVENAMVAETKDVKETKETKDTKDTKDTKVTKDTKESKETKTQKKDTVAQDAGLNKKEQAAEIKTQQGKETHKEKQADVVNETQAATAIKSGPEEIPVDERKVPAAAKSHLLSKTRKASNFEWFRVDRNYLVRYMMAGNKCFNIYGEDGEWMESRNEMPETTLGAPILNYIKDYYRKFRVLKTENVQQAPKIKFIEVYLVEKNSKIADPPVTKVFFDSNGKFSSEEKPEEDEVTSGRDNSGDDNELLTKVDSKNSRLNEGTDANEVISIKELPTSVTEYIKKNYPEHKIKESRYVFDDDLNQHIYYITIKKEGLRDEIEFYFSIDGKLLKKIDPTEQKANTNVQQTQTQTEIIQAAADDAQKVDPKELPNGIKTYLKQKYPEHKIEESLFKKDAKYGNVYFLTIKKASLKNKTNLYFDLNGKLVKTEQVTE